MTPLEQIDEALIALRHFWTAPPRIQDPALGAVEMSTIWVADCLRRTPNQTVAELAAALDVAHSTASRLIARAEHAGAVLRDQDPHDHRRVTVHLTEAGHSLAKVALEYRVATLQAATVDWTDAERATFASLLTRFAQRKETP